MVLRKDEMMQIPQEFREKLSNPNISKMERIELAEQIRVQYGQSRTEMIRLTGIGNTEYSRGQRIMRSGNTELIEQLRANNGSFREALSILSIPNYRKYRLCSNIPNIETALYEDTCTLLYQQDGKT